MYIETLILFLITDMEEAHELGRTNEIRSAEGSWTLSTPSVHKENQNMFKIKKRWKIKG